MSSFFMADKIQMLLASLHIHISVPGGEQLGGSDLDKPRKIWLCLWLGYRL
jgi:hypothetical protein